MCSWKENNYFVVKCKSYHSLRPQIYYYPCNSPNTFLNETLLFNSITLRHHSRILSFMMGSCECILWLLQKVVYSRGFNNNGILQNNIFFLYVSKNVKWMNEYISIFLYIYQKKILLSILERNVYKGSSGKTFYNRIIFLEFDK